MAPNEVIDLCVGSSSDEEVEVPEFQHKNRKELPPNINGKLRSNYIITERAKSTATKSSRSSSFSSSDNDPAQPSTQSAPKRKLFSRLNIEHPKHKKMRSKLQNPSTNTKVNQPQVRGSSQKEPSPAKRHNISLSAQQKPKKSPPPAIKNPKLSASQGAPQIPSPGRAPHAYSREDPDSQKQSSKPVGDKGTDHSGSNNGDSYEDAASEVDSGDETDHDHYGGYGNENGKEASPYASEEGPQSQKQASALVGPKATQQNPEPSAPSAQQLYAVESMIVQFQKVFWKLAKTKKGRQQLVGRLAAWKHNSPGKRLLFPECLHGLGNAFDSTDVTHMRWWAEYSTLKKILPGWNPDKFESSMAELRDWRVSSKMREIKKALEQALSTKIQQEQAFCKKVRGSDDNPYQPSDYEFCCARCRCGGGGLDATDLYSSWSSTVTLHRNCCHGLAAYDHTPDHWASPGEIAMEGKETEDDKEEVFNDFFREGEQYRAALHGRRERRQEADLQLPTFAWKALTHPKHWANQKGYKELTESPTFQPRHGGIVVWDFFGGVGTSLVALKKNGIKVKKYILVEIDPIAVHVCRFNHDAKYRKELGLPPMGADDSMEFVHIERFQDVEEMGVSELVKKHGLPDLVVGSPPCVDYSPVNANRQGVDGTSGSLHVRLGQIIRDVTDHCKGKDCYFVVENVVCRGDDQKVIEEAYGVPPVTIEAGDHSPQWRLRDYHTNIAMPEENGARDIVGRLSDANTCLEGGYKLPGLTEEDEDYSGGKSHTFMASKSRIDHVRMDVVLLEDAESSQYASRKMNVKERSLIMGYHKTYVTKPLKLLFQQVYGALKGGRLANYNWTNEMNTALHDFSGRLIYKFSKKTNYRLELGPPISGKSPVHFTKEEYGKHLIGNAYSVPVMALLMKPLKKLFQSGQKFEGFSYEYPWQNLLPSTNGDERDE